MTTCAILTNSCATHIFLSNPSNIASLTFHLSPTVAKASPHPKSRAFLLFDLPSLGVKARAFYKLPSRSRLLISSLQPQPRHSFPHSLLIPPPTIHPQSLLTTLHNHTLQHNYTRSRHEDQEARRSSGCDAVWHCCSLDGSRQCAAAVRQRVCQRHCCHRPVRITCSCFPLLHTHPPFFPSLGRTQQRRSRLTRCRALI